MAGYSVVLHKPLRWPTIAAILIALSLLVELGLEVTTSQPRLGVVGTNAQGQLVASYVLPGSPAWDAGIRPLDVVISIDGVDVVAQSPQSVKTAQELRVRSGSRVISATTSSANDIALSWRPTFIPIAVSWMLAGVLVFLFAFESRVGALMLALSTSVAATLLAALATPFGSPWIVVAEFLAFVSTGAASVAFFATFPVNRFSSGPARRFCILSFVATAIAVLLFGYAMLIDVKVYDLVRPLSFALVALEFLTAAGLAAAAAVRSSGEGYGARSALWLVALGVAIAFTPFGILSLLPASLGIGYLVSPDLSILSIVFIPLSLSVAILGQRFPQVRPRLQRGMVALAVWLALLAVYSAAVASISRTSLDSVVLETAVILLTFPWLQWRLRAWLELRLFGKSCDYVDTLENIASEIMVLTDVGTVSQYVVDRLVKTLAVQGAAIVLNEGRHRITVVSGACPKDLLDRLVLDKLVTNSEASVRDSGFSVVPLPVDGGEALGVLVVGPKRDGEGISRAEVAFLSTFAHLTVSAVRSVLLAEELGQQVALLKESREEMAALVGKLLRVQEEERRRIALELHAEPLQRAIILSRGIGNRANKSSSTKELLCAVGDIVVSLRTVCSDLHPPVLDQVGLPSAIERMINDVCARSDLEASFSVDPPDVEAFGRFDPDLETAVYRIAQEALFNCIKHAEAAQVNVTLLRDADDLRLVVRDNGRGFKPKAAGHELHLGILSMRQRLLPWRGSVTVRSAPSGGTEVLAEVAAAPRGGQ